MAGNTADIDETTQKLIGKMQESLPLRGFVMMSNGEMSYTFLDILIAILNKQFIKAIKLIITNKK